MDCTGDHYRTLGVGSDATPAALRHAYRERMRAVHPDLNKGDDAAATARAVNEAYRILADSAARARYDESRVGRPRSSATPGRAPAARRPPIRRQLQYIDARGKRRRQSWVPFVAFVTVAAGAFGASIASGLFDPATMTIANAKMPQPLRSQDKRIDELIERFVVDDVPPSVPSPIDVSDPVPGPTNATAQAELVAPLPADIAAGAGAFAKVSLATGLDGARRYSQQCEQRVGKSRALRDADRCAAFDFTAAYVDADVASTTHNPRDPYFAARSKQAEQLYRLVGMPAYGARARLLTIRRAVLPMITDVASDSSERPRLGGS
ncbi:J domain-containing protein [Sphingomonas sp. RB1R13]|uniref:J domain-containing protein n=1 Tax=Sphingomonas sp. RB1R13 TaxID=3096159 RepID=UPI002FCBEE0A